MFEPDQYAFEPDQYAFEPDQHATASHVVAKSTYRRRSRQLRSEGEGPVDETQRPPHRHRSG